VKFSSAVSVVQFAVHGIRNYLFLNLRFHWVCLFIFLSYEYIVEATVVLSRFNRIHCYRESNENRDISVYRNKFFFTYMLVNMLQMKVININDGFTHVSVLSEIGRLVHF
jgi:hypothetical protein